MTVENLEFKLDTHKNFEIIDITIKNQWINS